MTENHPLTCIRCGDTATHLVGFRITLYDITTAPQPLCDKCSASYTEKRTNSFQRLNPNSTIIPIKQGIPK